MYFPSVDLKMPNMDNDKNVNKQNNNEFYREARVRYISQTKKDQSMDSKYYESYICDRRNRRTSSHMP